MIHYITTNGIGNAWVAAELEIMRHKGVPFVLHSLRGPHQNFFASEEVAQLNRETRLIYPLPKLDFALSLLLAPFLFGTRFFSALGNALFSKRENPRARKAGIAHMLVACHWARQLRKRRRDEPISLIHAHWVHSAGTVAMYGAWLLDAPFGFTGHAVDLFRDRVALEDKIKRADVIICISEFHRRFYLEHGARPEQLHVVYCGIDVSDFSFRRKPRTGPPRIVSVGRLVEKKGFGPLIEACKILSERGVDYTCEIAGDGPLEGALRRQVAEAKLEGRVTVGGKALLQEELPAFLAAADIFAQPCVWSKDNDVDGTPRTLMEAMAVGLPSVSTRLAGIPDIIEDGDSGLLVEPNDAVGLADALERLIKDAAYAERIAEGGRAQIEQKFEINSCLEPLAALFRSCLRGPEITKNQPLPSTQHSALSTQR
jgi:glycosyltransferase involved in cell wall biosynthesis